MADDSSRLLRLTHQVEHDGLPPGLFTARVLERGDREVRRDGWATSARELPALGERLFRSSAEGGESVLFEADDVLIQINLYSGHVYFTAAAASAEAIDARRPARARPELRARGNGYVLDVQPERADAVVALDCRPVVGGDPRELLDRDPGRARAADVRLAAGARGTARALARCRRDGKDVRSACTRVGMARLVRLPLHRRSRHVLRAARRLPDERPAPAGLHGGHAHRVEARVHPQHGREHRNRRGRRWRR